MHPEDESIQTIVSQNDVEEARHWLAKAGASYGVIHELSHEESREVVEEAYYRGAEGVEVLGAIPDLRNSSVSSLVITLPDNPLLRGELFALEANIAMSNGFDPCEDEGQKRMLLYWT